MKRSLFSLILAVLGCGSGPTHAGDALPPLSAVHLTAEATLAPQHAFEDPADPRNPSLPDSLRAMLAEGFGRYLAGPGEAPIARTLDDSTPPAPGPNARRWVRFAHLSDIQLADDESPTRVAALDGPNALDSALRPQEANMCRILNAAVRTLNAIHAKDPLGFVLTGGDQTDSAQSNELAWVMGILDGGAEVECDSGEDDDPVPGPGNDGKDPFTPVGLAMPWYWVTGNHDVCVQGNFVVNQAVIDKATGDLAETGTRDWRSGQGLVVTGAVPKDARRRPLDREGLMRAIAADQDGHGIQTPQIQLKKAFYTFDVPGTPLRFFVLDSAAESGGAAGVIHRQDFEEVIQPTLAKAVTEGKLLVLASHHSLGGVGDASDFGGTKQDDAVPGQELLAAFRAAPVVFEITGHAHVHRVEGRGSFWEVLTSALADHPHQMRVLEIWDQDNGYLMLRATNVDFATEGDPIAEEGRSLGLVDRVSGWWAKGTGAIEDRNVELWVRRP
ncbi:MAG: hypothetical protein U1E65_09825 [Myxococcota bacterium]